MAKEVKTPPGGDQVKDLLRKIIDQNDQILKGQEECKDKVEELASQLEETIFRMDYPELQEN